MAFDIKPNVFHTTAETAAILGKKTTTLEKMRSLGTGPNFVKLGNSIFYPGDKLLEYFNQNTFAHGAAAKHAAAMANSPAARQARDFADSPEGRRARKAAEAASRTRRSA